MPTTIDATAGGASANSYVTLAAADTYFEGRFGTAVWDDLSDADKEKALRQAARELDSHRIWGYKNTTSQALQFPRAYPYQNDTPATATAVPQSVKDAQCEQALWIATNADAGGRTQRQALQAQGVKSYTIGDLSETFSDAGGSLPRSVLGSEALRLFSKWINRTAIMTVPGRIEASAWPGYENEV